MQPYRRTRLRFSRKAATIFADVSQRRLTPEWMDEPGLDPELHRRALAGLARLNWLSRSQAILWRPLREAAKQAAPRPVRLLDLACGSGDLVVGLSKRAAQAGWRVEAAGWDVSETATAAAARRAAAAGVSAEFFARDIFRDEIPPVYDVVCCSLFLHHLTAADAVRLLSKMAEAAQRMVLVNDLIRSPLGFALAWSCTRIFSRSPIVHFDGPRSVEGAFTMPEALQLAETAGLSNAKVYWRWPERYLLEWRKQQS